MDVKEDFSDKEWTTMTLAEIQALRVVDINKYKKYRHLFDEYYRHLVNALYDSAKHTGKFNFKTPKSEITIQKACQELMEYLYSQGLTREEIIQGAASKR